MNTFSEQASAEIRRRGVARAKSVCAVQDGAEWLVGLTQSHRHDAVRILDFAHAAQQCAVVRDLLVALGHPLQEQWLESMQQRLKHEGPDGVVKELEQLYQEAGKPEAMGEHVRYLRKRLASMQYPAFQKADWPIGSGMVESGNKTVMQARLKGAGMHWKPENVNPMIDLRMNLCNERWQEGWGDSLRYKEQTRSATRRRKQEHRFQQQHANQPQQTPPVVAAVATLNQHLRRPRDERKVNIAGDDKPFPRASFVKGAMQKIKSHPGVVPLLFFYCIYCILSLEVYSKNF